MSKQEKQILRSDSLKAHAEASCRSLGSIHCNSSCILVLPRTFSDSIFGCDEYAVECRTLEVQIDTLFAMVGEVEGRVG
eukprot:scaffold120865_cov18-Tisochrysis_lutea.AAC.3